MLTLAKFLPGNRGKDTPTTSAQVLVRNKGLTTATITWTSNGSTSSQSLARGQVLYLPESVKVGKAVNTVYESIKATFSSDHVVNFDVTKRATALTMYECTDKISQENDAVVTVINGTNHPVQVHAVSADTISYNETITLPQYGLINLPNDVPAGSQVDSTYSSITASWDNVTHFVADLAVVPSQDPWQDHVIRVVDQIAECAISFQNRSTQNLSIYFTEVGTDGAVEMTGSGGTYTLRKRIPQGQSIDTVYSSIFTRYGEGTDSPVDVTRVLNENLALTCTDVLPAAGNTIVGLVNVETDVSLWVAYKLVGDEQEYGFVLPAQGAVSLPTQVQTGSALSTAYTMLEAYSEKTLVWKADLSTTLSGSEQEIPVSKGTFYSIAFQNRSATKNLTVFYEEAGSDTTQQATVAPGTIYELEKEIPIGSTIDTVYSFISRKYDDTEAVVVDVTQELNADLVINQTDVVPEEGKYIVSVRNNLIDVGDQALVYTINGQDMQGLLIGYQGIVDLPALVNQGEALSSVYSLIIGTWNGETRFMADLSTTESGTNLVIDMVEQTVYHHIALDMNGSTIVNNQTGTAPDLGFPKFIPDGEFVGDPIEPYVYGSLKDDYTYTPLAGAHAADKQYAFHNGCTVNNGTELYTAGVPTTDLDLADHVTYGYWNVFDCDCYDVSVGYPGCSGVTNQAGETAQYKWNDLVNALHDKYPNRELVAMWTSNQKTTQVQFSTQTVDFVSDNWSEPVVPDNLSGTLLFLETREIE